jgi:ABC-type sugar transport system, permease component
MRSSKQRRGGRNSYLIAAICLALLAIMLFPLMMSLLTSVKPTGEAATWPPNYLPSRLSLNNYVEMYKYQAGLPLYLINSFSVAFMAIGGCVILASLAGFGLARFSIPYKEFFFLLLICGMMIPYQTLLTPLYIMFSRLGIQNTRVGLAIVHTAIQLPFSIFLMRHSFEAVPRQLEEAAVIDGCNSIQLLWRIFLPAVVPGIVTVALFAFLTSWNEFIGALIFMNKETMFTLPIMLVASRTGYYGSTDWGILQAGIIISIIPCVPVYLLLQKYYVSGLMTGTGK